MTAFPGGWYTRRTTLSRIAALCLAVAVAAACSGYNPPQTVRRGGELVVGLSQDAQALNPLVAGDVWSVRAYTPLFPELYEARADLTIAPSLAAGAPEVSADGLTWTVALRPARWSDGKPITAQDVVFTVQTEMGGGLDGRASFDWTPLTKVEQVDAGTVRFHLARPDAAFLADRLVTPIVPRHALAEVAPAAMAEALFSTQPLVAGGPFQLSRRLPGQSLTLVRNTRYYGSAPYLDTVTMEVIGDPGRLANLLAQGQVLWAPDVPAAVVDQVRGLPNVRTVSIPQLGRYSLVFNTRPGRALAGRAIRRAVLQTLDPRRVAAAAGGVPAYSGVNPAAWAYEPAADGPYAEGAPTAGALSGVSAELLYPQGDGARAAAAREVARELGAAGAAFTAVAVPPGELQARLGSGDFDAALAGLGEGVDPDPSSTAASWETPAQDPRGQNFGAYADPAVDALLQKELALPPTDLAARKAVLGDVQRQLRLDPPLVDLWTYTETDAFSTGLAGLGRPGPELDQDLASSFYARWSLAA